MHDNNDLDIISSDKLLTKYTNLLRNDLAKDGVDGSNARVERVMGRVDEEGTEHVKVVIVSVLENGFWRAYDQLCFSPSPGKFGHHFHPAQGLFKLMDHLTNSENGYHYKLHNES